jgi:hypothetical protein
MKQISALLRPVIKIAVLAKEAAKFERSYWHVISKPSSMSQCVTKAELVNLIRPHVTADEFAHLIVDVPDKALDRLEVSLTLLQRVRAQIKCCSLLQALTRPEVSLLEEFSEPRQALTSLKRLSAYRLPKLSFLQADRLASLVARLQPNKSFSEASSLVPSPSHKRFSTAELQITSSIAKPSTGFSEASTMVPSPSYRSLSELKLVHSLTKPNTSFIEQSLTQLHPQNQAAFSFLEYELLEGSAKPLNPLVKGPGSYLGEHQTYLPDPSPLLDQVRIFVLSSALLKVCPPRLLAIIRLRCLLEQARVKQLRVCWWARRPRRPKFYKIQKGSKALALIARSRLSDSFGKMSQLLISKAHSEAITIAREQIQAKAALLIQVHIRGFLARRRLLVLRQEQRERLSMFAMRTRTVMLKTTLKQLLMRTKTLVFSRLKTYKKTQPRPKFSFYRLQKGSKALRLIVQRNVEQCFERLK